MRRIALYLLLGLPALQAQGPMSTEAKALYESMRNNLLKAAEKMPEEHYSFKPSPDVRSFGQLIGHVADVQYLFCGAVKGERKAVGVEKSKTAKAELSTALQEAFAYCDEVYAGLNDSAAAEKVKFFGGERTKLTVLHFNNAHNNEHYGNIVTYLRIKGLVPPSSERR